METENRLTAARGKSGGWGWWKEGEGIDQKICMNDPRAIQWDGPWEQGMHWMEEDKGGKIGTTLTE